MLHDPAGNKQTRGGLSGSGGGWSHRPPSSTYLFESGPVHAGHLLRGSTGPSTGEAQRHLGSSADIDERTSTKTDEKTVGGCFLGLFVYSFSLFSPPSHFSQDLGLSLLLPSTGRLFLYFQGTLENQIAEECQFKTRNCNF